MISDGFHTFFQMFSALGSLVSGTDLVVVQQIILADTGRRQIGHDDISTGKNPKLTPFGMYGSKGCSCRQQDLRQHKP